MEDLIRFIQDLNERGPQIKISPELDAIIQSSIGYIKDAINGNNKEKKE